MRSFDERKDAFEKRFAHDEQMRFKVDMRANRLLGQWAAKKMGLSESESADFVRELIASDFEEAGRDDVFRKLCSSLGDSVAESAVREQMEAAHEEAYRQVIEES